MADVVFKQMGGDDPSLTWGNPGDDGANLTFWTAPAFPGGAIEVAIFGLPPGAPPPRIEVTVTNDLAAWRNPTPAEPAQAEPATQPVQAVRLIARRDVGPSARRAVKPAGASGANVIDLARWRKRGRAN
jgi:hypothetical protein